MHLQFFLRSRIPITHIELQNYKITKKIILQEKRMADLERDAFKWEDEAKRLDEILEKIFELYLPNKDMYSTIKNVEARIRRENKEESEEANRKAMKELDETNEEEEEEEEENEKQTMVRKSTMEAY